MPRVVAEPVGFHNRLDSHSPGRVRDSFTAPDIFRTLVAPVGIFSTTSPHPHPLQSRLDQVHILA